MIVKKNTVKKIQSSLKKKKQLQIYLKYLISSTIFPRILIGYDCANIKPRIYYQVL